MNKRCMIAVIAAGAAVLTGGICTAVCVIRKKKILPFVPVSELIRSTLFLAEPISLADLLVVIIWGAMAFVLSLCALTKRE